MTWKVKMCFGSEIQMSISSTSAYDNTFFSTLTHRSSVKFWNQVLTDCETKRAYHGNDFLLAEYYDMMIKMVKKIFDTNDQRSKETVMENLALEMDSLMKPRLMMFRMDEQDGREERLKNNGTSQEFIDKDGERHAEELVEQLKNWTDRQIHDEITKDLRPCIDTSSGDIVYAKREWNAKKQ